MKKVLPMTSRGRVNRLREITVMLQTNEATGPFVPTRVMKMPVRSHQIQQKSEKKNKKKTNKKNNNNNSNKKKKKKKKKKKTPTKSEQH